MARGISGNLDAIMTTATTRRPTFEVSIYDLRSGGDLMREVVIFNKTGLGSFNLLAGPRIFAECVSVALEERRGDYATGGVASTIATLQIVDRGGIMDPAAIQNVATDDPAYVNLLGRYLRRGNAVVIRIGDDRVDSSEWVRVFTGEIVGQAGYARTRSDGPESVATIRAISREAHFAQFKRTSQVFGTTDTFLFAAQQIAQLEMGLDLQEIYLSGWGGQTFGHASTQFVDEPPIMMLARLLFPDGLMPRFDGDGALTQVQHSTSKAPARIYPNLRPIRRIERPWSDVQPANCVTVVGLDKNQTKILQPEQLLASVDITTGFFASNEDFKVYWSDERTIVAASLNPKVVLKSLTGGVSFTAIPVPGPGGGNIGVRVTVDTGYAPYLATLLLVVHIIFAAIPDLVIAFGEGVTISVGRILQAVFLSGAIILMTRIGRFQFEFYGEPQEWVFKEIRERACVAGQSAYDQNDLVIENHLLNTSTIARNIAREVLFLQQASANPRDIEMMHDLRLEPADIFETPDGRRYLIDGITYNLVRDPSAGSRATYECFEVTAGVVVTQ